MRSVNASELKPGDVIFFSTLGWNPRRRTISEINPSGSQITIRMQDKSEAFLDPEQKIQVFQLNEILHCGSCNQETDHCLGNCNECGDEFVEWSEADADTTQTSTGGSPQFPPPPKLWQSSNRIGSSPRTMNPFALAESLATAVGFIATIGGVAQLGLAIWLYHLTDTGRVNGLDSAVRAIEAESGITTQNEFHVIAFGIGISGLLFVLLGIGVFASLEASQKSSRNR